MAFRPVIAWLITWIVALSTVTASAADISGFRVWTDPEKTRAVLDLDARTDYQVFTLDNPPRVVIDLPRSDLGIKLGLVEEHAGVIENVRHGRPEKNTLRIVLDLEDESAIKSFMLDPTGDYGHRLVVDLFPKSGAPKPLTVKQMADLQDPDRDILVAIDAHNKVWINRREVDIRSVRANIERLHAENPKGTVVIQADKDSRNELLVQVMDASRLAGVYEIALAAEN